MSHIKYLLQSSKYIAPYSEKSFVDYQSGFRTNRSKTDHTFILNMLYEKCYEFNKYLHQLHVDIKHSMGSDKGIPFLLWYLNLDLKVTKKIIINQGRSMFGYQAGRQRFCTK